MSIKNQKAKQKRLWILSSGVEVTSSCLCIGQPFLLAKELHCLLQKHAGLLCWSTNSSGHKGLSPTHQHEQIDAPAREILRTGSGGGTNEFQKVNESDYFWLGWWSSQHIVAISTGTICKVQRTILLQKYAAFCLGFKCQVPWILEPLDSSRAFSSSLSNWYLLGWYPWGLTPVQGMVLIQNCPPFYQSPQNKDLLFLFLLLT